MALRPGSRLLMSSHFMPRPRSSMIKASSSGDHLDCFLAGGSPTWEEPCTRFVPAAVDGRGEAVVGVENVSVSGPDDPCDPEPAVLKDGNEAGREDVGDGSEWAEDGGGASSSSSCFKSREISSFAEAGWEGGCKQSICAGWLCGDLRTIGHAGRPGSQDCEISIASLS